MAKSKRTVCFEVFLIPFLCGCILFVFPSPTQAQQTLGGITGTVSDASGGILPNTSVSLVNDQTKLSRTQTSNASGIYDSVNLPIGSYTLTFSHDGFESQKIPSIVVQADRTATVNATLKVGQVGTTVTVEASPLMNAVDTTNGYILEKDQIQFVPLPTGSFTGLAILSPGVNAELSSGTGVNSGLGNQPIWANGQRDTSNTFLLNGVDASNLFNGKSTSSVASARIVNNTGIGGAASISSTTAEPIQSTASPYLAIGQALPTPAPETIEEFRVNTSMYDAQQGSTSGAHLDMSTASGQTVSTAARTSIVEQTPLMPLPSFTTPTPISRRRTKCPGCTGRLRAAHWAGRSSKISSSALSPTSTFTIRMRRSAARALRFLLGSRTTEA